MRKHAFHIVLLMAAVLVLLSSIFATLAQDGRARQTARIKERKAAADELLVGYARRATAETIRAAHAAIGAQVVRHFDSINADLVKLPKGVALESAIAHYTNAQGIKYAEPNYVLTTVDVLPASTPNDPSFGSLWGLHNTGQSGGTADADIDAPEAWDLCTGSSSVIVAVIDTGVDYNHPDLANNMWTNPGEIPGNGLDDDDNELIDDYYGYDFCNGDGDPMDDNDHGTHCSGTIGAVGNNGIGVAGVNWNVRIMALKFLDSGGSGYTSDAIDCLEYATAMGAHVSSNSWGGGGFSQAMEDAIEANGRPFIAAAGNSSMNNDTFPHYPSSYSCANVVAVLATDRNDQLASFSNFGAVSTDLAAPGVSILSTVPGSGYSSFDGTSMATPHVAGVAALVLAHEPPLNTAQVIQRLYLGADPLAVLSGKCVTGGRLNAYGALTAVSGATGSLRVTLGPAEAVAAGAQWTWAGAGQWFDSGETATGVPTGTRTVTFKEISSWGAPASQTVEIEEDQLATATATYTNLWPGPDAHGYSGSTSSGGFEDISATGTAISFSNADDGSASIQIGFDFIYCDLSYSSVWIGVNGAISFSSSYFPYTNTAIPSSSAPLNLIAPFWDDLDTSSTGWVKYEVLGEAPNRRLIIQWLAEHYSGPIGNTVEFQIKLYETSDSVELCYNDVYFGSSSYNQGRSATIGIQDGSGSSGLLYSYNGERLLSDDLRIAISRNTPPAVESVAPSSGLGYLQTFTAVYSDGNGAADLEQVELLINTSTSSVGASHLVYRHDLNEIRLYNDAGDGWASATPGDAATLSNSQVSVDVSAVEVTPSGTSLEVQFPLEFYLSFSGEKNIYLSATDISENSTGWQMMGNYTVTTEIGSLEVSIEPQGAIGAGAQWRRQGTETWHDSGDTVTGIPAGTVTVEYKEIAGWDTPPDEQVAILAGQTATTTGTYELLSGSLQVNISPQGAVDAGAKWRRTGTGTWLDSGYTESGIPVGEVTIEFKTTPGWTEPSDRPATINRDETTTLDAAYTETPLLVSVSDGSGMPGDTVPISVSLSEGAGVLSFGFDLTFDPDVLEYQQPAERGGLVPGSYNFNSNLIGNSIVRVGGYSGDGETTLNPGSGVLAIINFKIKEDVATETTTELVLSDISDDIASGTIDNGQIEVIDCVDNYDVNQDGSVTPGDALLTFQHYLGISTITDPCSLIRADANDDGSVTPGDALIIFQAYLGLD